MKNNRSIKEGYPRVFICTFCKKEFTSMGSVFSHMNNEHEFVHKANKKEASNNGHIRSTKRYLKEKESDHE